MDAILKDIQLIEDQIETVLWSLENEDQLEKALVVYQNLETRLRELHPDQETPAFTEKQRVLAYNLMRQGNLLRQLGRQAEAMALAEREIHAARLCGDEVTLARSLLSYGANQFVAGEVENGLEYMRAARDLFENGDSFDHRQGLGWFWILQADLSNSGYLSHDPDEILEMADRALMILESIGNWPGVARAYAARAVTHEQLGDEAAAAQDRQQQQFYEEKEA